jgi:hypothetical protein
MTWNKPELVEINMSAEIGAYQEDFEEREDLPFFASSACSASSVDSELTREQT